MLHLLFYKQAFPNLSNLKQADINHDFKKYIIFLEVCIRKLNLTLNKLRLIEKSGNISDYKSMSNK